MTNPDWPTVGASIAAAFVTLAGKMGWDKARGGNGAVQKALDEHKADDTKKFTELTDAVKEVTRVVQANHIETIKTMGQISVDVAKIGHRD